MQSDIVLILKNLLDYNYWSNQRILANLEALSDKDYQRPFSMTLKNINELLNHMYYYDKKTYERKIRLNANYKPDSEYKRSELPDLILSLSQHWLDWIQNFLANPSSTPLSLEHFQMIQDLMQHNTYHRGQLSTMIASLGYHVDSLDIYLYQNPSAPPSSERMLSEKSK